jgi:hypothetical protein
MKPDNNNKNKKKDSKKNNKKDSKNNNKKDRTKNNKIEVEKVKPAVESIKEPITEPIKEPITEPITEPIKEPIKEPVIEPILKPEPVQDKKGNKKKDNKKPEPPKKEIKEITITPSNQQTKKWRQESLWYKGGKRTECEKFQIEALKDKLKIENWERPKVRLNITTFELKHNITPITSAPDGFEWTEDFDGLIKRNSNQYNFNLKLVCDAGGAQNRSLREVYHFIKCQLEHLKKFKTKNIYFINILDGDTSYSFKNKYTYLREKEEYKDVMKYLYVGDLFDFVNEEVLKYYNFSVSNK